MPDARAVVTTGATISATTTGRIPLKTAVRTGFPVMVSGVRNMAMANIIRKHGMMVPAEAARLPFSERSLSPTTTAIFTASIPGSDCATASRSRNSVRSSQWRLSTTSRSMMLIMAQPPPKVNAPIFANVQNRSMHETFASAASAFIRIQLQLYQLRQNGHPHRDRS